MLFMNSAPLFLELVIVFRWTPIVFGLHFRRITVLLTYPSICTFVRLTTPCTCALPASMAGLDILHPLQVHSV